MQLDHGRLHLYELPWILWFGPTGSGCRRTILPVHGSRPRLGGKPELRGQLPAARAGLARARNPRLTNKRATSSYGPSGTGTGTFTFTGLSYLARCPSRLGECDASLGRRMGRRQSGGVKGAAGTSLDTLGGKLRLLQPRTGYRVNIDSLLLVSFAGERRVERVVDLGAGVGTLGLLALAQGLAKQVLLVESDPKLAELARENLKLGGFAGEVRVLDVARSGLRETGVPLVLCNPPYYPAHSHRAAQTPAKAAARTGEVAPFLLAAAGLLARKTGRALFSYPAPQLPELLAAATRAGLVAKRLRLVHARDTEPARLALVELRAARPGGLVIEPPLLEWIGRRRSPELAKLSGDRASDRK